MNGEKSVTTATTRKRLPELPVHLRFDSLVFLITELQDLPPLDTIPVEDCKMRFRVVPGLLLCSPQPIIYPLLMDRASITTEVELLSAAMENENPFYGMSLYARIRRMSDYTTYVHDSTPVRMPYELTQVFFPEEVKRAELGELHGKDLVRVDLRLPTGYELPELGPSKIVRLSVNLFTGSGGLAPNGQPLSINSRSRPTFIHVGSAGAGKTASDFYRLSAVSATLPVTSSLPAKYSDYTDVIDPHAAAIARARARNDP